MTFLINPYRYASASGSDPYFSDVVLLASFDGTDGATTATDDSNSGHSLTFNGNAQIDTAQSKFGGASLYLDGTGDYVSIADSADWYLTSPSFSEFTIEAWVRWGALSTYDTIMGQWEDSTNRGWVLQIHDTWTDELMFRATTNGASLSAPYYLVTDFSSSLGPANLVTGQWYHIACDRGSDGRMRIYVDGVCLAMDLIPEEFFNSTAPLTIGAQANGVNPMNGWIDELRITKGVGRYASNSGFTPPTAAYPRS